MLELHLVYAYERYLSDHDPTPLHGGDDYVEPMSFEDFKEEYYYVNLLKSMPTETTSIEELEHLVTTSQKESVLSWVFDNLDYSIYEHLCFITGDAD